MSLDTYNRYTGMGNVTSREDLRSRVVYALKAEEVPSYYLVKCNWCKYPIPYKSDQAPIQCSYCSKMDVAAANFRGAALWIDELFARMEIYAPVALTSSWYDAENRGSVDDREVVRLLCQNVNQPV